ncbi:hypothetical protein [Komagataeibacter europaeus]|uniref:hypothetical protein n=1 Tax=Komagataeibacter europaeus TaxID=33995 RepID=UPI0002FDC774|nr:hypothetical protein [Komagataeibacter europaeus]
MTYNLRVAGGLTEPLELVAQNRYRVFLRWRGEIVAARPQDWHTLVESGRVVEVGNG